jgi:putative radical SAM enzyme (TIGR03279 family)
MVRIEKVDPDGPLGPHRVASGDRLHRINGVEMRDLLDVRFAAAEERLALEFVRPNGATYTVELAKHPDLDLGLELEPMKIRACNNSCDFCFVFQQPKKTMRRELYIMDDDYRYSFLYGNFITLTNVDETDIARIIEQRLSPLYVSVHATDDGVRREFLRSPDAMSIMPLLGRLAGHGIQMHTQIVVIPGFNDGEILERSISNLAELYPAVQSLAVVPVGLTRYRSNLPNVETVTRPYARRTVARLREVENQMRERLGVGFVYTADEFFVLAGAPFARGPYYDDFAQFENGVGMGRQLLDHFRRERSKFPERLDEPLDIHWVTGESAATFLLPRVIDSLNQIENLTVTPVVVANEFFGHSVTVSGLLTGRDIVEALKRRKPRSGMVLLPPNCLNHDGLFLDDLPVSALSAELGLPVVPTEYDFMPGLRSLLLAPRRARSGAAT